MIEYSNESTDEDTPQDAQANIETIESDDISYDSEEIKMGDDELDANKKGNKQSKLTQRQLKIRRAIEDRLEQRRLREQLDYLGDEIAADIDNIIPIAPIEDEVPNKQAKAATTNKAKAKPTIKQPEPVKKLAKPTGKAKAPVKTKPTAAANTASKSKAKSASKAKAKRSGTKK